MKILVTGANGQLGYDIVNELKDRHDVVGIDLQDMDITNKKDLDKYFSSNVFDALIHCAAYTSVDDAEDNERICTKVNVEGTKNLVNVAVNQKAKFIYFSTDYVFDGLLDMNKCYLEKDSVSPISVYGNSKELGEREVRELNKHYILRISWVYGKNGKNFPKTMLQLSNKQKELNVISDQVGSPTYTLDIAKNIEQFLLSEKYGTYHFTNVGYTNWNNYAKYIFYLTNKKITVNNILTKDYKTKARRPLNSKLNQDKLVKNGFTRLPSWKDAVKRFLKEIGEI